MSEQKPVVLIDGSSYLYRAFHALPPLTTSTGQPTGAVRGVANMLRKMIKDYQPDYIGVIFDAKGKTFRDEMFEQYKANRPPMPDDLRAQVEPLHALIRAMGLPLIVEDGVEADDVIGTFARRLAGEGRSVIISTGDKDMAQLVDEHVTLVNTMTDTVMDPDGVVKKFGIPPSLIIDYLALMGDKVDNIPGVPGVGEKTALALIQGLGSLENIYANLEKVAELDFRGAKKMPEKLAEHRDMAFMSYQLATIKTDCVLKETLEDLRPAEPDREALERMFRELEFKSWLNEAQGDAGKLRPATVAPAATQPVVAELQLSHEGYETILTLADLQRWIDALDKAKLFAFDTETTSLNYMDAELVGVSFAIQPGVAAYVPLAHDYPGAPDQLDRDQVLMLLKPLLESDQHHKIGQNLKYDMSVLANYDITLRGVEYDTMLESYVLDSVATRHDMDSLALKYLGHKNIAFAEIAGKGSKQLTFNQVGIDEAARYAAEDADVTLQLHQALWPKLEQAPSLVKVFCEIDMPLVPVLSRIERNGCQLDADMLRRQSNELAKKMVELEQKAWDVAGQQFNLSSPKQLGEILYGKLEIPVVKKTPTGQPSTAEAVLEELALDYELPQVIMDYRSVAKLKSTYTDKLPEMISRRSGRLHTSYHQAVAATGRLSSSDPNLQNIPVRTEEGRRIRQAFVAPPGRKLVAADYSQIELRIMAHLSGDAGLLDAFAKGLDIHRATAAEVAGKKVDEVTDLERRNAKAINFGLIYGMSAFGLAKALGIDNTAAKNYIQRYFERFAGVRQYMDDTRAQAKARGYVETVFGRRLYLPEINSPNGPRRSGAERAAINAPMQGTAADLIKLSMVAVQKALDEQGRGTRMIMQVHDELVFEVPQAEVDWLRTEVPRLMAGVAALKVPLLAEVGMGANWDQAH